MIRLRGEKISTEETDRRGFRTKRDAEAFAASVEVSKLRGEYLAPRDARVLLGDLGPA